MGEENKGFSFVKCCEHNDQFIYYHNVDNVFYLDYYNSDEEYVIFIKDPIEYCPWCGILLDTNLLED